MASGGACSAGSSPMWTWRNLLIEISPEQADDVTAAARARFTGAAVAVTADMQGLARCVAVSAR